MKIIIDTVSGKTFTIKTSAHIMSTYLTDLENKRFFSFEDLNGNTHAVHVDNIDMITFDSGPEGDLT